MLQGDEIQPQKARGRSHPHSDITLSPRDPLRDLKMRGRQMSIALDFSRLDAGADYLLIQKCPGSGSYFTIDHFDIFSHQIGDFPDAFGIPAADHQSLLPCRERDDGKVAALEMPAEIRQVRFTG